MLTSQNNLQQANKRKGAGTERKQVEVAQHLCFFVCFLQTSIMIDYYSQLAELSVPVQENNRGAFQPSSQWGPD